MDITGNAQQNILTSCACENPLAWVWGRSEIDVSPVLRLLKVKENNMDICD